MGGGRKGGGGKEGGGAGGKKGAKTGVNFMVTRLSLLFTLLDKGEKRRGFLDYFWEDTSGGFWV